MPLRRANVRAAGMLVAGLGLMLSLVTSAPAQAGRATGRALPVINAGYLYSQLYTMASSYIYRISGLDGPPQNPSSPANLPMTINGWQEFFAHWKAQMTSQAAMGPLSRFLKVSDHYFRVQLPGRYAKAIGLSSGRMPYDSDVAEVTIPGASCPGQRVLLAGHPDSTPAAGGRVAQLIDSGRFSQAMRALYSSNLGNGSPYDDTSGVTMGMAEFQALLHWWEANGTWPARTIKIGLFDAEETGLNGSFYYASHLIPAGPQGHYVLVANMDQNGLEYPAYHWGTDHYLNNLSGGGVGPWYTNINSSPLAPNSIYNGQAWKNIQANMPAIRRFRAALQDSVTAAFATLGRKYGYRVPLENPLLIAKPEGVNPRRDAAAYTAADQRRFSPVQDDTVGRTDQVPFLQLGIPGYGVLGAYDTNNIENPYPASYKSKPVIFQYAGYDTLADTIEHLNLFASGTPHGPGGPADPSVELRRALELPATWTDYLVAKPDYGGAVRRPDRSIAYFETTPVQPATTRAVHFDATFSADLRHAGRLSYRWDFGDGSFGVGARVTHTYTGPIFADVKLLVTDASGHWSAYRQAVAVDGVTGAAPNTPSCGTLTATEAAHVRTGVPTGVRTGVPAAAAAAATVPWQPVPGDYTDPVPFSSSRR